jgi:hypothetical protein
MYDRLIAHFPIDRVFRDLDSLPIGKPFRQALDEAVANSNVALIVIGPTWVSTTDAMGHRRLEDPNDYVRREVEMALNAGFPVVPVLVLNASIPDEGCLPESLRPLARNQAISVRPDPDFNRDMDRLIGKLSKLIDCDGGRHSESSIREAKAFEAGRLLMGTFLELHIDSDYDYTPFVERAAAYLADLDVRDVDYSCMSPGIDLRQLRALCERINQQLWARTSVAPYFEASLNLFTILPKNDKEAFKKIVSSLSLPSDLKHERNSTIEWLADLRKHFEGILFPPQ